MTENPLPSSEEARTSLDQVAASRRAAVAASRRPVRLDASFAAATGIALGVAAIGGWPAIGVGRALLLAAGGVFAAIEHRRGRRRGRILDERALGAQVLRFFPLYFIWFVTGSFRPGDAWRPWYSIGVGIVVALTAFAFLRLDDRYQTRRLAAGDYDRYDLL